MGVSGNPGPSVANLPNIAGVIGSSDAQPGVIATSNAHVGVYGFSRNSHGVWRVRHDSNL
jgi:hypothetical protein